VITHEARSQVRLYRDAAGCESVQTVNHQFRVVTVTSGGQRDRLVVEEVYDQRKCLETESSSSEATITAWLPDSGSAPPRFKISGRGLSGMPIGNLYRLMATGCCGSAAVATYYSLLTGQLLFASSLTPLELDRGPELSPLLIGFHDSHSAVPPAEAADSTVVGVLVVGNDREPARRLVLVGDRGDAWTVTDLRFSRLGKQRADSALAVSPDQRGAAVSIELRTQGDRVRTAVIPILHDSLAVAQAVLPPGFRFRRP
jgi:hypothetical protein